MLLGIPLVPLVELIYLKQAITQPSIKHYPH